jgi:hypothetical protein
LGRDEKVPTQPNFDITEMRGYNYGSQYCERPCGEVAEWSNAPDSKSGVRFYRTVSSNLTLSAKHETPQGVFCFSGLGFTLFINLPLKKK